MRTTSRLDLLPVPSSNRNDPNPASLQLAERVLWPNGSRASFGSIRFVGSDGWLGSLLMMIHLQTEHYFPATASENVTLNFRSTMLHHDYIWTNSRCECTIVERVRGWIMEHVGGGQLLQHWFSMRTGSAARGGTGGFDFFQLSWRVATWRLRRSHSDSFHRHPFRTPPRQVDSFKSQERETQVPGATPGLCRPTLSRLA
ncbi:hypothetical protein IE53DRAFT_198063 [Violaceomyces palustris]|uniref:Uncharacterized protein n=1 Tax=Violaceomyces palustris TaxID=1673888 RepID=A0ACD0NRF0_9BASI|nr:hypothetical protein IE53DRAFT_198063 [Violaceomyces palustris]